MADGKQEIETPVAGPRSTFVIGGVGHRDLGDQSHRIREAILQSMQRILNEHTGTDVTLLTSVAEGADRLFLQAAVQFEISIHCVLPCSPACFREDFSADTSREEFERFLSLAQSISIAPAEMSKEAGYLWASEAILDGCDVLLAVWDGDPGRGPAGTESTIAQARARNVPVLWIHSEESGGVVALDPVAL